MDESIQVLHVDDEPGFAETAGSFLEREDERIVVRTASDADEGLSVFEDHDIDCVVSDYDMPGDDGIAFFDTVRDRDPDRPFILYTGKGSEEVASEAISAGVTDYLQKEGGTDQYAVLANRITNAVESARSQRALAERNRDLRRYERMINSMLAAACIYDREGRFRTVNEYLAEWYGTTRAELEGEPSALLERVREQADGDPYEELLAGEREEVRGTVASQFPGHGYAVLEYRLSPLRIDGRVESVVGVTRDVTEREEQTRRLETVISNLPGIVYRSHNDPDWPMEFVRGECESLTGYTPNALEANEVLWGDDVLHPDDRERTWEIVQDAIDDDGTFEVTYRITTADDVTKWVWERGRAVPAPSDEGVILEGFITDITEQKDREQRLERTNALRSSLLDTLPDGVLVEDESRNVLATNERLFDLFGLPGSPSDVDGADCEAMAREVSALFVDPDAFVERIGDVIGDGQPVDGEELSLADGRTFERSYRPIELPDGNGHLWVYRDVTERVEREEELALFRELIDESNALVFINDAETGELVYANRTACRELGYDESELLEKHVWEIETIFETRSEWEEHVTELREEGRMRIEGRLRHEDDSTIPVDVNLASVSLETDYVVAIARDVSERIEHERDLQRQNERLERFASVVAHDLRNPLNVAGGRVQLLAEEYDSEHFDAIERAHDRIERIVGDLLWLSKARRDIGSTEPVALGDAIEDAWAIVADDVDGADLVLKGETDRIEADADRLAQLLENVLQNALDHGGEPVTVTAGPLPDGFYVADDGPGIPDEERERVFEFGYSTSEDGTGIGLSIVDGVATAHGWEIEITESEAGGSRFEITGVDGE